MEKFEVKKENLPKGIKSRTIYGTRISEIKESEYSCNVLKIVPMLDWNLHKD